MGPRDHPGGNRPAGVFENLGIECESFGGRQSSSIADCIVAHRDFPMGERIEERPETGEAMAYRQTTVEMV